MKTPFSLRAWLQLFRLPNLLTVPGDPLAGYILASYGWEGISPSLWWVLGSSLCLYLAGLVINDLVDVEQDREERPERPLPSGRVSVASARAVAVVLVVLAFALAMRAGRAATDVAALLIIAVLLYNLKFKQGPLAGPIVMGSCRGLNLLLGAAAVQQQEWLSGRTFLAAVILGAYVASVTHLARGEAQKDHRVRWAGTLPLLISHIACVAFLMEAARPGSTPAWAACLGAWLLAVLASLVAKARMRSPDQTPAAIGILIGALLFYQAAFCFAFGVNVVGIALVVCWPVFWGLGKWFYAS